MGKLRRWKGVILVHCETTHLPNTHHIWMHHEVNLLPSQVNHWSRAISTFSTFVAENYRMEGCCNFFFSLYINNLGLQSQSWDFISPWNDWMSATFIPRIQVLYSQSHKSQRLIIFNFGTQSRGFNSFSFYCYFVSTIPYIYSQYKNRRHKEWSMKHLLQEKMSEMTKIHTSAKQKKKKCLHLH